MSRGSLRTCTFASDGWRDIFGRKSRAGGEGNVIKDKKRAGNCEIQGQCNKRIVYALPAGLVQILDSDDEGRAGNQPTRAEQTVWRKRHRVWG